MEQFANLSKMTKLKFLSQTGTLLFDTLNSDTSIEIFKIFIVRVNYIFRTYIFTDTHLRYQYFQKRIVEYTNS